MDDIKRVLVLGRHTFIMDKVIDLLNQNRYDAMGVSTDQKAVELILNEDWHVVVFGGGVALESITYVKSEAIQANKKLHFIIAHPQTILEDLKKVFDPSWN